MLRSLCGDNRITPRLWRNQCLRAVARWRRNALLCVAKAVVNVLVPRDVKALDVEHKAEELKEALAHQTHEKPERQVRFKEIVQQDHEESHTIIQGYTSSD
jgi:hypothetical protein